MPRLDIQFGENNYLSASDRERLKSLEDAAKRLSKTALLVSVTASEDRTGIGRQRVEVVVETLLLDGYPSAHIFTEVLSLEKMRAQWVQIAKFDPQFSNNIPDIRAGRADTVTVFVSPNDPPLRTTFGQ